MTPRKLRFVSALVALGLLLPGVAYSQNNFPSPYPPNPPPPTTIGNLPTAGTLTGTELIPMRQAGHTGNVSAMVSTILAAPNPSANITGGSISNVTLSNFFLSGSQSLTALEVGSPTGGIPSAGNINTQGLLVNNVALGSAAFQANGTSGSTFCLLSALCTFSGNDQFTGGLEIGSPTGGMPGSGIINAAGIQLNGVSLGTAATQNTGTSGATIPLLNGNIVLSGNDQHTGGLEVGSPTGGMPSAGTVNAQGLQVNGTSVLTGNQTVTLTGPVTGSGATSIATTISSNVVNNGMLAQIPANSVKGNNTGSTANAADLSPSQVLDIIGNTQGGLLYRDSLLWKLLGPGTSGQVLQSGGASANPSWLTLPGNQTITISGDTAGSGATAITTTTSKVNGVSYPSGPSTNTVPVVTGSNTITYEALPASALAAGAALSNIGTNGLPLSDLPQIGGRTLLGNQTSSTANVTSNYVASSTDATIAAVHGSITSGDCAKFNDTVGTLADGGVPCGGTITLSGDTTGSGVSSITTTTARVNGISYPATVTSGGVLAFTGGVATSSGALSANNPVIGGGAGATPSSGSRSGNTTTFGTTSGALTNGHCAQFDANGNVIDAGQGCSQGVGTGVTQVTAGAGLTTSPGSTGGSITTSGTLTAAHQVNAQTGTSYTVANGDQAKLVTLSNASAVAVTLPQAGQSSSFLSGWEADFANLGAGAVTITPTTSTIDGGSSIVIAKNQGVRIFSDGTNYETQRGVGGGGSTVTLFTSGGTFTPGTGATTCVLVVGGGGGGGGGAQTASGTAGAGGGGGGGGGAVYSCLRTADLGASVTVTVGVAGTAGSGSASTSTAGSTAGIGGVSKFGSFLGAGGGGGGEGGPIGSVNTIGGGGGAPGLSSLSSGASGNNGAGGGTLQTTSFTVGASGISGGSNNGTLTGAGGSGGGGNSISAAGGGGGGGAVTTTPSAQNGANGGANPWSVGGTNGSTGGGNAPSISNQPAGGIGGGGGGGGSSITGAGGTGAVGQFPGGGGGGGGAALNGSNGGNGAAGGGGEVVVWQF
jgi:hypothetical protein